MPLYVKTGSADTERFLKQFLVFSGGVDGSVNKDSYQEGDYMLKVMTTGRNGEGDVYEGSQAPDDTGGFLELRGDDYCLTDKAKKCIRDV